MFDDFSMQGSDNKHYIGINLVVIFKTASLLDGLLGRVRMANSGSSRVSRDPFELVGALSK